ncbi:MAG: hypothetical protein HOP21_04170 [Methylotenera sp.]|nr:hypothetical protein [Methylotenera sp.]
MNFTINFRQVRCLSFLILYLTLSNSVLGAEDHVENTNEAVAKSWQQQNVGAATPALIKQEDGTTKIEWHGGVTVDHYRNTITSASDKLGTNLNNGYFVTTQAQSDLRAINPNGAVNYFQLSATTTDDRAVLNHHYRQINMMQVGRVGEGYQLALGDVAPNFSNLSSAFGARGLFGQKQINQTVLSGYAGLYAPSWEYLDSTVPRQQLLKEVQGAKLEQSFTEKLKVFVTTLHARDRRETADIVGLPATALRNNSVGFQWNDGAYQLTGETAISHFQQQNAQSLSGRASLLDGAWRGQKVSLKAGYHDLEAEFSSLSQSAQPGIRERYVGGDWVASAWLSLGLDLRNSQQYTFASFAGAAKLADTDSGSLRANINLGASYPGWGITLQQTFSNTEDANSNISRKDLTSAGVSYATARWNAAFTYGYDEVTSQANPAGDSHTNRWQASASRAFNNADELSAATWTVTTGLSANLETQKLVYGLLAGEETRAFTSSLNVGAQRNGWGTLNLMVGNGFNTRMLNQSTLRMTTVQFDASRPIGEKGGVKLYWRDVRRNIDDLLLDTQEKVVGVQLSYQI